MTALKEFQRLEAAGHWRATPHEPWRDVIVSIGDATLTITDMTDRPLAHWSLAAVERQNPGQLPAMFHPDGDPTEALKIDEDESTMLEAIQRVQSAIDRARPHPGRLRLLGGVGALALVLAAGAFWLPNALQDHALSVVSDINRKAIGQALQGRIERLAGQACVTPQTAPLLAKLADRTNVRHVVVLRDGVKTSLALPGGIYLLNSRYFEAFEDPAVAAGAILVERARVRQEDPLLALLEAGGIPSTIHLLTKGQLRQDTLDSYAKTALKQPRPDVQDQAVLAEFTQNAVPSSPYAYAMDPTGETTIGLIEADPVAHLDLEPLLSDQDWVQLQNICG